MKLCILEPQKPRLGQGLLLVGRCPSGGRDAWDAILLGDMLGPQRPSDLVFGLLFKTSHCTAEVFEPPCSASARPESQELGTSIWSVGSFGRSA